MTKAEALKAEKSDKERELQNLSETSGASGHQKLRVCDICGAYLSVLDSDRRLADHFGGKVSTPADFIAAATVPSPGGVHHWRGSRLFAGNVLLTTVHLF